ncbi:type II secretion system minor pseudopilin GspH [Thalassotalea agarivorans]|uniref:Type II secretion system protein H n=1 Tax=Thalassotalea agarivorans TaxID=349064 RepID=A0A1I0E590_THASX|nr:type II secretion system minor pseudopilin GspH [Thalassotalea agarivorans]SET39797.1 general secretion pathway protein H [Thalassotalea agarivorans]
MYRNKGFTLIEIMLVLLIIGIVISSVQVNLFANTPEQKLEQQSQKFKAIFETVADYSVLNNMELGLVVKDNSYQFVAYDGTSWVPVPEDRFTTSVTLPEEVTITLNFDDLPIEEPQLFDPEQLIPEDEDFLEQEKKITPQVYILSGGDITPFEAIFELADADFYDNPAVIKVTGLYATPLTYSGLTYEE